MSRLSWRKQPNEKGLRAIGQSPRGFEMRYAGETIASVYPHPKGWGAYDYEGWGFSARADEYGVPHINSGLEKKFFKTAEEAKKAADAYVRKHFKKENQQ